MKFCWNISIILKESWLIWGYLVKVWPVRQNFVNFNKTHVCYLAHNSKKTPNSINWPWKCFALYSHFNAGLHFNQSPILQTFLKCMKMFKWKVIMQNVHCHVLFSLQEACLFDFAAIKWKQQVSTSQRSESADTVGWAKTIQNRLNTGNKTKSEASVSTCLLFSSLFVDWNSGCLLSDITILS